MELNSFVKNSSTKPGVYIMYDSKDTIIYIGKAKNLRNRLKNYFFKSNDNEKIRQLVLNIARIELTVTPTEVDALLLEISLIKKHQPHYNIQFKDSKGYPYIVIDISHEFPRLFTSREKKHQNTMRYFGPYPNSKAMYFTLNHLYKIFKIRDCKDSYFKNRSRPCLRYQIDRCHAPCTNLIGKDDYRYYVDLAIKLLENKDQDVLTELRNKMNKYADSRDYYKAKEYRDLIHFVQILLNKQIIAHSKGNCDFIALVSQYGNSCIHIIRVRNDEISESKTIFPDQMFELDNQEILIRFLSSYYLNLDKQVIPANIFVNITIDNQELLILSEAISKLTKKKVTFTNNSHGNKKELLDISISSS
ncbi:MAG: excinuclease ABC subunit C [Legionellales bacterium]|nr:excinuclease ABC subunit C [Legionellales bacterium]